jgi:hypothetical protein
VGLRLRLEFYWLGSGSLLFQMLNLGLHIDHATILLLQSLAALQLSRINLAAVATTRTPLTPPPSAIASHKKTRQALTVQPLNTSALI